MAPRNTFCFMQGLILSFKACVVELVYTQDLKSCARKGLGDRDPSQAPICSSLPRTCGFAKYGAVV